ncbi:MAG: N-acetylneuraminate synthase family protein [Oscillospiraceae bacterium]|jgi:N-acetylneuraminate synthase|nr:N-acetylneuraminate synthase family protein [Oscillospiraceae bacterium]
MAKAEIKIGKQTITKDSSPYLIAEIGINHNGDMAIVKKLIDSANATNWDSVKFQKRVPELSVPEDQKAVLRETPWGVMTYLEYKKRIEFDKKEYDEIDLYCRTKPIDWSASPWDIPSVEFLAQYNLPYIKIASALNANVELIKRCCEMNMPLIVSTGMSTIEETDETVELLEKYSNGEYILMHTNSSYPAKNSELNIRMIETLKNRYKCLVGYSGHEQNIIPTVIATALGAVIIERHITVSHDMWGTDQKASLEVHAMYLLRNRVVGVVEALGDGVKELSEDELSVRKKLRGN